MLAHFGGRGAFGVLGFLLLCAVIAVVLITCLPPVKGGKD
jgi:hypothetical protein